MSSGIRPGFLILFLLILGVGQSLGQSEKTATYGEGKILRYYISNWQKGKEAAVTLTFDDGYRYQFVYAAPLLNARNFKGTFFIVTNRVGKGYTPGWDSIRYLSNQGHEIGSHSMNHALCDTLAMNPVFGDSLKRELLISRQTIDRYLPFQKCRSFAWPGGNVNKRAIDICRQYYLQARSSYNNYEFIDPKDFFILPSRKGYHGTTLKTANLWINDIIAQRGWLIEAYHGFRVETDTNGYEPIDLETFRKHLDYIKNLETSLWVAPLYEVAAYIRERQTSSLTINKQDETGFRLSLKNNLPDSLNLVPLSLGIPLSGPLQYLTSIRQNQRDIPFIAIKKGNTFYATFDCVPNKGEIEFSVPVISFRSEPPVFGNKATIVINLSQSSKARISISDPHGKFVQQWEKVFPVGESLLKFNSSKLEAGEYTFWLEIGGKSFSMKTIHE